MSKKNKRPATFTSLQPVRTEFNPDYSMVKKDLRRIGTLAGIFIVILIGLTFFLR